MKKKSYFVIEKSTGGYSSTSIAHYENIDSALEGFKYLSKAEDYIEIDYEYIGSERRFYENSKPEFVLKSVVVDVYIREELDKLRKEQEEKDRKGA